jgi:hypothetical protein
VQKIGGEKPPASSELDGDLSEDPIAASLVMRINTAGGINNNITDADAKKKGIKVNPPLKLTVAKGPALLDIALPAPAAAAKAEPSPNKKPSTGSKPSGLRGLRHPTGKTPASTSKKADDSGVDLGPAVSSSEDPIGASLQARVAAGSLNSNLTAADATKKKVAYPQPLKLKIVGKETLTTFDIPKSDNTQQEPK